MTGPLSGLDQVSKANIKRTFFYVFLLAIQLYCIILSYYLINNENRKKGEKNREDGSCRQTNSPTYRLILSLESLVFLVILYGALCG